MHSKKDLMYPIVTFFMIVGIWQLIDFLLNIKEVIFPSPIEIYQSIIENYNVLLKHTSITMVESVLGFIIGASLGVACGILFVYSSKSKKSLYPYAIALKATPLYALAPLLVLWFGNGIMSKIVMSAMVAFFPVLVNAVKGFSSADQESLDLFKSLSASKLVTFSKLRFPSSLPYIFPALKTATTLAVVGATIAEFTGASSGIGHLIVNSSYYLDTSIMFAGIIFISIAGVLFFYFVEFIERRVVFWQNTD